MSTQAFFVLNSSTAIGHSRRATSERMLKHLTSGCCRPAWHLGVRSPENRCISNWLCTANEMGCAEVSPADLAIGKPPRPLLISRLPLRCHCANEGVTKSSDRALNVKLIENALVRPGSKQQMLLSERR